MATNVHPTSTARSGSIEESRQKQRGTKYHCKQCGFVCDVNRDGLGEKSQIIIPSATAEAITAGDGTITVDATTNFLSSGTAVVYDDTDPMHTEHFVYSGKTDTVFTVTSTIAHNHSADCKVLQDSRVASGSGCPFCGSPNWM